MSRIGQGPLTDNVLYAKHDGEELIGYRQYWQQIKIYECRLTRAGIMK